MDCYLSSARHLYCSEEYGAFDFRPVVGQSCPACMEVFLAGDEVRVACPCLHALSHISCLGHDHLPPPDGLCWICRTEVGHYYHTVLPEGLESEAVALERIPVPLPYIPPPAQIVPQLDLCASCELAFMHNHDYVVTCLLCGGSAHYTDLCFPHQNDCSLCGAGLLLATDENGRIHRQVSVVLYVDPAIGDLLPIVNVPAVEGQPEFLLYGEPVVWVGGEPWLDDPHDLNPFDDFP